MSVDPLDSTDMFKIESMVDTGMEHFTAGDIAVVDYITNTIIENFTDEEIVHLRGFWGNTEPTEAEKKAKLEKSKSKMAAIQAKKYEQEAKTNRKMAAIQVKKDEQEAKTNR